MLAVDFVEAYPRTAPIEDWRVQGEDIRSGLDQAEQLSQAYGGIVLRVCGAYQEATDLEDHVEETMANTQAYMASPISGVAAQLWQKSDKNPHALRYINGLHFHDLNTSMLSQWVTFMAGDEMPEPERRNFINHSQFELAQRGLWAARSRQRHAERTDYFAPGFSAARGTFEGMLNEIDAAIVLLELAKHNPGMSVLPAPAQFEKHAGSANVDFLVTQNDRMVGVQMKSSVRDSDIDHYDKDRVVIIDGDTDMLNKVAARTKKLSSDKQMVTKAGLVSLGKIMDLSTTGKKMFNPLSVIGGRSGLVMNPQQIARMRFEARTLMGGLQPRLHETVQHIKDRILQKL